jgi:hypothetical protein
VGIEQRRHPRFGVHLAVRYANAEQFVTDYVENLSAGGLFITGAQLLPLFTETEVQVELPGQGSWTVKAKVVFAIDDQAAIVTGRRPGAGLEITGKPPGFDDALLGYLLRLGQRRDHSVMVGDVPGIRRISEAGYRVIPIEPPEDAVRLVHDALVRLLAVLLPANQVRDYQDIFGAEEARIMAVHDERDMSDLLARLDSLL